MSKPLILFNGRWRSGQYAYIAAYSVADAIRLVEELGWENTLTRSEITKYWNKGAWGNSMEGIPVERGLWVELTRDEVPTRMLSKVKSPEELEIEQLRKALRVAHSYMLPEVSRGPAHYDWCDAIQQVESLIGENEGTLLIELANTPYKD